MMWKNVSNAKGRNCRRLKNNVEYFNYLGGLTTCDATNTYEINSMVATEKAAFNKKTTLFTSKLDLHFRKKLVKCYIWSIAFYSAKTGHFGKQTRKAFKVFKCSA